MSDGWHTNGFYCHVYCRFVHMLIDKCRYRDYNFCIFLFQFHRNAFTSICSKNYHFYYSFPTTIQFAHLYFFPFSRRHCDCAIDMYIISVSVQNRCLDLYRIYLNACSIHVYIINFVQTVFRIKIKQQIKLLIISSEIFFNHECVGCNCLFFTTFITHSGGKLMASTGQVEKVMQMH